MEFVGYMLTPHGIRMRKKTTQHIKRALIHIMNAFAFGAISYESAMESVICYVGMCKHCNGFNLLRWIEDNLILRREEIGEWNASTTSLKTAMEPPIFI